MKSRPGLLVVLALLAILLPILSWGIISQIPPAASTPPAFSGGKTYPASKHKFTVAKLPQKKTAPPQITNVQIIDVDGDQKNDILYCDSLANAIGCFQWDGKTWTEKVLIPNVAVPAHATVVDIDGDGDLDILASVLGNIFPDDHVIGRVELYENVGDGYKRHLLLDDVRRVADIQAGDLDGDGDLDLAVAVFGYARGSVLWLENLGDFKFRDHQLLNAPGTIHVPIADFDGDGDLDITAIVTQDEEELWGFENLGDGKFRPRRLWMTLNYDLGGAGLVATDLDGDNDIDLILPAGDNLEDLDAYPQPYHGCYWFENQGNWDFQIHRVADLGGTYAASPGDLDNDGDQDIVLVSMANDSARADTPTVVWLENDGQQNFTTWAIATDPLNQVTVAVGDADGDGWNDIVTGGLNVRKPFHRLGRVSLWLNEGNSQP